MSTISPIREDRGYLPLSRDDSQAIATELNEAYKQLDGALAHSLRLGITLIETAQKTALILDRHRS